MDDSQDRRKNDDIILRRLKNLEEEMQCLRGMRHNLQELAESSRERHERIAVMERILADMREILLAYQDLKGALRFLTTVGLILKWGLGVGTAAMGLYWYYRYGVKS